MADTVEIEIEQVIRETDRGTLIETDEGDQLWLPSGELEFDGMTMTLPRWLAKKEGLISDDDRDRV